MMKRMISLVLALAAVLALLPAVTLPTDALWQEFDERYEVDGSYYTTSSKMATKLNQIFDGNANIYHDSACTNSVNVRIGTSNVKNNGIIMYTGPYGGRYVNSGTSCWIYAAGVYYTLFGNIGLTNPTSKSERLDLSKGSGRGTSYANFVAWGVRDAVGAHIRTTSHSMIVLDYDENTITIVDGNNDGRGKVSVRKRSWDQFNYTVDYIVQPTDEYYYSEYPVYDCEHSYSQAITQQASCTKDGVMTYSCTKCPDKYTVSIPATGHNFSNDYCVICGAYDSSVLTGTCGTNLKWTLRKGALTVSGSGNMYDYAYNGAPWYKNKTTIKSIVIDGGITNVGDYAFSECENLTSVTIGDSVTTIGDFAFQLCNKVSSLTLGKNVQTIGLEAFKCTAIKKLEIPDSTTYIGDLAFGFCNNLASVKLGKKVATIRDAAFSDCYSLKEIIFTGKAPTIGEEVFCNIKADVYFPTGSTWTNNVIKHYGGNLTWTPYYSGLVNIDGVWKYYEFDVFQKDYFGLVPYEEEYFYVEGGIVDWDRTGFILHEGNWCYVQDGRFAKDYNGLMHNGEHWLYVEKGMVNWDYTGLISYNDGWYYIDGGVWKEDYTDLVYYNDTWFYVENGFIDWGYTGLVPYNGNYFYVQNNVLDWAYTGLGYHDGEWYFIQNALLQLNFVGLVYFNGTWFYVENGHLTWDYTGMAQHEGNYFYVQNNVLDWGYTGLGYHDGGWYFIQNALLQAGYYGLVYFNDTWFYIEDSRLTWTTNGLREHEGKLFYITNSEVNWGFNGTAEYAGIEYTVVNGVVV